MIVHWRRVLPDFMKKPGQRQLKNFAKRFGDPPRIIVKFENKPLEGAEREYRNKRIVEAFKGVLKSLLGRDPTDAELFGKVDISKALQKGLKSRKTSQKVKKPALDFQI